MAFIRKIKKGNSIYLAEVESYREDGKVKQRVLRYLGKEVEGVAVKKVASSSIEVQSVKQYLDYKVLHQIAIKLGLPGLLGDKVKPILLLIYTQLIPRKPIYKLPEYIEQTSLQELLGFEKLIDKHLYEALDALEELDFTQIENHILTQLSQERKERKALVLDVTDTYFNGHNADWKARKGKDGKYDKLLQIALAVTKEEGFPILHKTYEGNISNIKIFQDLLAEVRLKKFDIIILDRGMISAESLLDMESLNQKVITGIRTNERIKREFLSTIAREEIYQPACRVKLKNTTVYVKTFDYGNGQMIAIYNPELETIKREHAMDKAESYNPEKARYLGYSLVYHTTALKPAEVINTYFEKDIVEKAYKELKSTINLHPIRKYRINHIKAHVKICYLAYAILSYIHYRVKPKSISAVYALEKLQSAYKITLESIENKTKWDKIVTLNNEQKKILALLDCSV